MSKLKSGMLRGLKDAQAATPAAHTSVADRFDRAAEALAPKRSRPQTPPAPAAETRKRTNGAGRAVRHDGFTFPLDEYETIANVQRRASGRVAGHRAVSKSLVVRAGLAALDRMSDDELLELLTSLPEIKTGKPPAARNA